MAIYNFRSILGAITSTTSVIFFYLFNYVYLKILININKSISLAKFFITLFFSTHVELFLNPNPHEKGLKRVNTWSLSKTVSRSLRPFHGRYLMHKLLSSIKISYKKMKIWSIIERRQIYKANNKDKTLQS